MVIYLFFALIMGVIAGLLLPIHKSKAEELYAAEYFARDRGVWLKPQVEQPTDLAPVGSARSKKHVPSAVYAMVTEAAHRHGIPPRLLHGIVRIESGYNCHARNRSSRATGIGQVLPRTAHSVGVYGSLTDCSNGIEAAARYLKLALDAGGYGCAGLSLYERGIAARPVCTSYGRKVMRLASL